MSGIRAVLFDFFGTMTMAVARGDAHAEIARRLGCAPDAFIAELNRTYALRASGQYGSPVDALRRVARAAGGDPTDERLTEAVAAQIAAVRAGTRLRPEAVRVLAGLRRHGLLTALVSDCCHELPAFLPDLPVAGLLSTRVLSIEQGVCKPDPRMYLTACERLGVRPGQCLYVGDGGSRELSGAEAVGMAAVRLAAPDLVGHLAFNRDESWIGPRITSLGEVLRLADGLTPARRRRAARTGLHRRDFDRTQPHPLTTEAVRRRRAETPRQPDRRAAR